MMDTITDCVRFSEDVARASIMTAEQRKYRLYRVLRTYSGTRVGEGAQTETITEIGHVFPGQVGVSPPYVEEVGCGVILGGGHEQVKLEVKNLAKAYATSLASGGYASSFFFPQATNANQTVQFRVVDIDTGDTHDFQLEEVHDHAPNRIDLTLMQIA